MTRKCRADTYFVRWVLRTNSEHHWLQDVVDVADEPELVLLRLELPLVLLILVVHCLIKIN